MASVNWDEPSSGLVSDANPALALQNDKGKALTAASADVAVFGVAPATMAVIGANRAASAATVGVSLIDPAIPDVNQNKEGVGVLGATDRSESVGASGLAIGPRSLGVLGQALSGTGVRGLGSNGGVEGVGVGGPGVMGLTQAAGSVGVYGFGPGPAGAGVRGEGIAGPGVDAHSSAGPAVRALSDQAQGVVAEAKAANAAGVFGRNDHKSGVGVDALSQDGTAVRGRSTNGTAVDAYSMFGRGVNASTDSLNEPAVNAIASVTPAVHAGSFAQGVDAFGETGVKGGSLSAWDPADSQVGAGVFGHGVFGAGVCGTTLTGIGVVGIGLPGLGAWAGYLKGNVLVQGILMKIVSLFSIDHPLDPERKVLNHASVEAPEYKTFYDGMVTLDARGRARVRLPRWFEALNRDLRYQLTPVGAAAPDLHVAQEVEAGAFVIAGGAPRQKVCWQVTGVRQDAWALENPLKVEQPKREARPRVASPSIADLERQAEALKERDAALRAEIAERKRAAKARRPPAPLAAQPLPAPPPSDPAPLRIAEQAIATARRPTGPDKPRGSV